MTDEYGPWVPLDPVEVRRMLRDYPHPWWIAGGWAIDMFLGRKTRDHEDTDVEFLHRDALDVRAAFAGWDLQWAHGGAFEPWAPGVAPSPDQWNAWARPAPDQAWALQPMLSLGDETTWVYRRVPTITRPMDEVVRHTGDGLPYLAPEVQLLYKAGSSAGVRPKDQVDFDNLLPHLDERRRAWLRDVLPADHPWRAQV